MKNNNIFNMKRFWTYFMSDIKRSVSDFGLSMLLFSLTGVIFYMIASFCNLMFQGTWEGPGIGARIFVFFIAMFVLFTSCPVKCYGRLTERKAGSSWILLPVSRFEKYLSMLIVTVILIPAMTVGVYMSADMVMCFLDKTCGASIMSAGSEIYVKMMEASLEADGINSAYATKEFISQISNPWLYLDDVLSIPLTFLLGALVFKNRKTAKTLLAIIIFSTAGGVLMTPVMSHYLKETIGTIDSAEGLNRMFNSGLFKNTALIDTINDSIYNIAILIGIWFRIKNLKH